MNKDKFLKPAYIYLLLVIIIIGIMGYSQYAGKEVSNLNQIPFPPDFIPSPNEVVIYDKPESKSAVVSPGVYQNYEYGFEIKYPQDWVIREGVGWKESPRHIDQGIDMKLVELSIGYDTEESVLGGIMWVVRVYDSNNSKIEDLIRDIGGPTIDNKQEKRGEVYVDGIKALKVVVTVPLEIYVGISTIEMYEEIIEKVFVEKDDKIFAISGKDEFYKSFTFLD